MTDATKNSGVTLMPSQKYVNKEFLMRAFKISRQGLYYMMKREGFPKPAKTFRGKVYWMIDDIEKYFNELGISFLKEYVRNE